MDSKLFHKIFTEFMVDYKENVYRLAYSYVKHPQNAMDVVQDSIQKALTKSDSLTKPQSMKSWFYRIVVNTALDYLRREKKLVPVADEVLEQHGVSDHDVLQDLHLAETLDELPMMYREVIILRFFEDMKLEDVALVLNIPLSTVKSRLYQSLKILRMNMKQEEVY
ncbi:RNA polymerase sigma factor [Paenibacillus sp. FSL H7-0756]|uniref:RNA polymerase sigma factor n=1 Tax=unclassified Paenibacillus TaxID=185978 RepID=UPI0030F789E6